MKTRANAVDRGEKALEESLALVQCLREACDGKSNLSFSGVVTLLDMVNERMTCARTAFGELADAA